MTKKKIRNKPVHVLLAQRNNFLKTCPVCGSKPRYIKGTNIVFCDHTNTEHSKRNQYVRLLDARGVDIAQELFGR